MLALLVTLLATWLPQVAVGSSQPAWSPNGKRIAYVRADQSKHGVPTRADIYIIPSAGLHPAKRVTHGGFNTGPAWSPDGRRIAFLAQRASGAATAARLLLVQPNGSGRRAVAGSGRRAVASFPHLPSRPTWSPDSKHLALTLDDRLLVLDAGTGASTVVATVPAGLPAWAPGGDEIALGGGPVPYLIRLDGSGLRALPAPSASLFGYPSWSPDGSRVAFGRCVSGGCNTVLIPRTAASAEELGGLPVGGPDPAWSPDGRRLATSCLIDGHAVLALWTLGQPGFAPTCGVPTGAVP